MQLQKFKIVDLSKELIPKTVVETDEPVDIPERWEDRRLALKIFKVRLAGKVLRERMTYIDTMSHIGTHVECPSHYLPSAKSVSDLPLESFIGEAICIDLSYLKPGSPIRIEDLEKAGVKEGDIVLLHSKYRGPERPYISSELAQWLAQRKIKMLGVDDGIIVEESFDLMSTHENLLRNDIPLLEGLANLESVCGKRFYFIGLPLRIRGLESSPIRAIAILMEE